MSAIGVHHGATTSAPWDGPMMEGRCPSTESALRASHAWVDPNGDPAIKASYKFIHHMISMDGSVGAADTIGCSTGIGYLNHPPGTTGRPNIPAADRAGVYAHLAAHIKDADMTPPELRASEDAPKLSRPVFDRAQPISSEMEFRAAADGGWDFTGYASLFDTPSDASWMAWKEIIRPTAFNRTLNARAQHTFVVNHDDNLLLASTRTDRLHLSADSKGLLTEAKLPATSYANDLRELHAAGETRGMSFTFKPTKNGETWTTDANGRPQRELTDVQLGHVTVVTTLEPGFSGTARTMQFRALADEIAVSPDDLDDLFEAIREGRALNDAAVNLLGRLATHYQPSVQPEPTTVQPELDLAALKAKAEAALAEHKRRLTA